MSGEMEHVSEVVDAELVGDAEVERAAAGAARARILRAAGLLRRPDRIAWALIKYEIWWGPLGIVHAAPAVWRWVSAAELDQQLATNPKLVLDTRRTRWRILGIATGSVVLAGAGAWVWLAPAVPIAAGMLALTVAGLLERRHQAKAEVEAGRAALGPAPPAKAVRRALSAARLGRVDEIRVIGPVVRTGAAWEATAELPPGTTYKHATKRRSELAGAIGVDEVQVALDPVRGHHGRVRLWVADEDPMQGERVTNPLLARRDAVDFWAEQVFAGRDPRGRAVEFSMAERSYLIGGEPGGGKSVASNNLLAWFFMDPRTQVYLADGKFGFDLMAWESMAKGVLTDRAPEAMIAFLAAVQAEMDRRYALLRRIGVPKVTAEVAARYDLHPIVVHIDEVQHWSAGPDKKLSELFMVLLADLVGRGRAAAIITGCVTQRPAAEVVPTRLRDILSIRWALRCTTPQASDTVLGSGWAGRGYSASLFEPSQRGAGYLLAEGSTPMQTRAAFLDPDRGEVEALARRAYALREAAGTLPASADRPEVRLLTAVLEAMGAHHKGAHTHELLDRLTRGSEEYAGWGPARLAAALRPLGVEPVQLDLDGTNRNGYRRADVQAALERV